MLAKDHPVFGQIELMSDSEKLSLVDYILNWLDRPDPEIDRWWVDEAVSRWKAYKAGKLETVSYDEVMSKYHL